ncbi:MAG: CPBP family intramembrane glutamic endopeptidase [Solirubrobacteraceae bacterium]
MSTLDAPERPDGVPERAPLDERPWSAWWALPIALGAVVAGGVFLIIAQAIHDAVVELPAHQPGSFGVALHGTPPAITLVATLGQDLALVGLAVLAAASALKGRITPAAFGLRPARLASSAGFVIGGYVLFILISAAWVALLGIQERENVAVDLGTRDSALAAAGAAFLVCVVAPLCEELFFRGFLFGALRKRSLTLALVVSGGAFGLAHVASSPIGFIVPLATLGVILALLYERTGSLYPSISLHALNNSIAFGAGDGRAWLIPICLVASGLVIYAVSRIAGGPTPWRTAVSSA